MSNFDRTGPNGQGAMTGKGRGSCNLRGQGVMNGYGVRGGGRFGRRGFGRGMGLGQQEIVHPKEDLQAYKKTLESELVNIDKEIDSK